MFLSQSDELGGQDVVCRKEGGQEPWNETRTSNHPRITQPASFVLCVSSCQVIAVITDTRMYLVQ